MTKNLRPTETLESYFWTPWFCLDEIWNILSDTAPTFGALLGNLKYKYFVSLFLFLAMTKNVRPSEIVESMLDEIWKIWSDTAPTFGASPFEPTGPPAGGQSRDVARLSGRA